MANDGTSMTSLAERLRAKTEQDRSEIEAVARKQLSGLSESLLQSSQSALNTTEAAILGQLENLEQNLSSRCQAMSWIFARKCLQIILLGLCLISGLGLGGIGLLNLATEKITALKLEIEELNKEKETLSKTLFTMESKTWGIHFVEKPEGRFIILPSKITAKTGWTLTDSKGQKQQAIKLE